MTDEPTEVVPASPDEIAKALSQGRSLSDRIAQTHASVFQDAPGIRDLYVDIFQTMLAEAEQIPGYTTAMALLVERYAFVWATQKAADSMASPLNARDYEGLILRFRQLWESMLKARDDRQADAKFKATFITQFMRVFADVCDETFSGDESMAFQRKMVQRMRAVDVQGTERGA